MGQKQSRIKPSKTWHWIRRLSVFSDDLAITIPDNRFEEDRFVTIGMDAFGRILVVVFTWRSEDIRLISARLAERRERKQYEED